MKLICAEYNAGQEMTVGVIGDNALLRNNEDFYFPRFTKELSCVPQLVVKACKLGKGFSPRFASRYYNEIGVGVRFYADTLEKELREKSLPYGLASSFDDSAVLSDMSEYSGRPVVYTMLVNNERVFSASPADLPVGIDQFVSQAGSFYMIKIGDYFYCGNPFRYRNLQLNDRIRVLLDEECLLDFYIK